MGAAQSVKWFAARTRYGQELKVRDRLVREGVEHFVPEKESGGPVIPCMVFLRTSKQEALDLANYRSVKMKLVIDCATRTLLVVPDKQMEDFQRVLEQGDVEATGKETFHLGDRVKVVKGPLKGVEGNVLQFCGKTYVVVSLIDSLFAKARVPRSWLVLCDTNLIH